MAVGITCPQHCRIAADMFSFPYAAHVTAVQRNLHLHRLLLAVFDMSVLQFIDV